MAKKRKRGRPYTGGADPVRVLGRIPDKEWKRFKRAAAKAGLSFTQWVIGLMKEASK